MSLFRTNRGTAPFCFLTLLMVIFLSGCASLGAVTASSPEQAVRDAIRSDPPDSSMPIDQSTVRIRHTQALDERDIFYLVSFNSSVEGRLVECMYVYETYLHPRAGGWVVGSGGGGCLPTGGEAQQHGGGQGSSGDSRGERSHSLVYGQAPNPDVVTVQVDWADGQVQEAPVINGVYLVVREGMQDNGAIRFLNSAGETLETLSSEKAPGKK